MSQIAGMCPLSFDDGLPRIDYLLLSYYIFIMSLICLQSINFFIYAVYFGFDWVYSITLTIQNLLLTINLVSSYLCLAFNRDSLRSVFVCFMDADKYFAKFGKKPSYKISLFHDFILLLLANFVFLYIITLLVGGMFLEFLKQFSFILCFYHYS